jgi:hypothetical protein
MFRFSSRSEDTFVTLSDFFELALTDMRLSGPILSCSNPFVAGFLGSKDVPFENDFESFDELV